MVREASILVFDIGKTTKKALVFDRDFHVMEESVQTFSETQDDDGFPADDLVAVSRWLKDRFQAYVQHPRYAISHCNVSAYGASLVNLDAHDDVVMPFYNYLKPFEGAGAERFARQYNAEKQVCVTSASPDLGFLNSGLQLYWQKTERPQVFKRIATTLHLPQYFSWLLSGHKYAEITSIGCHTMLWDYRSRNYHAWVKAERLDALFPPIAPTTHHVLQGNGTSGLRIGVGVHDSSAALMPYLATRRNPFMLLSTGTWNICFNPFNDQPLTEHELALDCLCYLTYEGLPVKASRIFLGHEHEVQAKRLTEHFAVPPDAYQSIAFNGRLYERLEAVDDRPFYPLGMVGTGPLPHRAALTTRLDAFADLEEAYHQLVRYLVQWQLLSLDLVDPEGKIGDVIVVGGFTKSPIFLEILSRKMKNRRVLISDHPRASALGAAWLVCGKEGYEGKEHLLQVAPFR